MKIILSQQITLGDFRKGLRNVTKTFESNVVPHKGDFISDSVWKDPYEYEVQEVNINYQQDECYVQLPLIKLETNDKESLKGYIEMTRLHEWVCAVEV
ncbi:hypothetical protein G9F72_018800 [Clostridium estertheticum]|uniref:hypothetical protein n=1 Tax=Clostridium estertheticum TaxID=238834 RepID=UPI0013E94646|nr:hypothetical protein [Clostridium estertheticum]MBZ9688382.1 hypothetical protein [Clostridium estertheticum]